MHTCIQWYTNILFPKKQIPVIYLVYTKIMKAQSIYQVYTRYIPCLNFLGFPDDSDPLGLGPQCPAAACKRFSIGCHCQSGGPLQNCLRATVTLRPGPGLRLPSPPGRAQGIQVTRKAHAGDVMASAEGAAGPAPGVRHQPEGGVHPNSLSNRLIPFTESALHQRWWCSGMKSRSSCIRFWVRIRR